MSLRTFGAAVALAALLGSLSGCAFKFGSSAPAAADPLAAGNAAFEQKNYVQACDELSKAGGGAEVKYRAGLACAKVGQDRAEMNYKAALAADARFAPAMEGLGLTAYGAGDLSRARSMLEAGASAGGKDPQAALTLGQIYLLDGQCDRALAAFQEALRRDPGSAPARMRLGAATALCGNGRKAAPTMERAPTAGTPGGAGASPASGASPAASPKEPAKPKPAPKTIDLNDI